MVLSRGDLKEWHSLLLRMAFVEFEKSSSVDKAAKLHGTVVEGRPIKIDFDGGIQEALRKRNKSGPKSAEIEVEALQKPMNRKRRREEKKKAFPGFFKKSKTDG